MSPASWFKKYEDVELKASQEYFDGGDFIEQTKQVVIKMLEAMKMKFIFYELSYWMNLSISQLLDIIRLR